VAGSQASQAILSGFSESPQDFVGAFRDDCEGAMHEQTGSRDTQSSGALSIHRSFVVRLYSDLNLADERIRGLAEHVVSGAASEFDSVGELVGFMRRVLATHEPEP
jgi:hypothetical protein